jgi:phenylpyruvate tautomerase PptA (4-oxalocrotonate tautomerase family)
MPYLQIIAPQGLLDKAAQGALVSRVSDAILKAERADTHDAAAQSLVWAHFVDLPQDAIYVGGKLIEQPPLRIAVHTPEGALTDITRGELVSAIGQIVDDLIGPMEGRLNHWAMLYEVTDGNWGAGQVLRLPDIQSAMNIKQAA